MAFFDCQSGGTTLIACFWGFHRVSDSSSGLLEYDISAKTYKALGTTSGTKTGTYFKVTVNTSGTTLGVYAVKAGKYAYTIGSDSSATTWTEVTCTAGELIWSSTHTGSIEPMFLYLG